MNQISGNSYDGCERDQRSQLAILEDNARIQEECYSELERQLGEEFACSSTDNSFSDDYSLNRWQNGNKLETGPSHADSTNHNLNQEELHYMLQVRLRENEKLVEALELARKSHNEDNIRLQRENSELAVKKMEAEQTLEQMNRLLVGKQETITVLESRCSNLEEKLKEEIERSEKLSGDQTLTNLTVKDLQSKILRMEKDLRSKVEVVKLEKQFEEKEEKHRREINQLKEELQLSYKKFKTSEAEKCELSTKLRQLSAGYDDILAQKTEMVNRLTHDIDTLKGRLASSSAADVQLELRRLQRRETDLESELLDLRHRYEIQTDELTLLRVAEPASQGSQRPGADLYQEILRACSDNKSLRTEIAGLQTQLRDKERTEQGLRDDLASVKRCLIDKDKQLERLQLRTVDVSLSDDQKITEMREENDSLQQRLLAAEEENRNLQAQLAVRNDDLSSERCNEQSLLLNALKSELEEATLAMESLRLENEKIKDNLKDQKEKVLKSSEDKTKFEKLLKEKDDQDLVMQALRDEMKQFKDDYNKLNEINESHKSEAINSRTALEKEQSDREQVSQQLGNVMDEMIKIKMENEELQEAYRALKNSLTEVTDVQQLKIELELARQRWLTLSKTHGVNCQQALEVRDQLIEELKEEKEHLTGQLEAIKSQQNTLLEQIQAANSEVTDLRKKVVLSDIAEKNYKELERVMKQQNAKIEKHLKLLAEEHEKELLEAQTHFENIISQRVAESNPKTYANAGTLTDRQTTSTESTSGAASLPLVEVQYLLTATRSQFDQERQDLMLKLKRSEEKFFELKLKAKNFKTYFKSALARMKSDVDRDCKRYVQVLEGLQRDLKDPILNNDRDKAIQRIDQVVKMYDERIETLKRALQRRTST